MFILEYGVTDFPCTLRYFSSSGDESALIYFHPCPGLLVIKKLKIKRLLVMATILFMAKRYTFYSPLMK